MQSYFDTVTNQGGAPISGASVFVYDSLGALATLFSDNGVTPQSNPIVTGADGKFIFFAANGIYSAVITAPSYNSVTITGIALNDPAPAPTFTGTGAYVLQTSPTLITPNLGTPSAAVLTSASGLPIDGGTTGTLPVNRGGTGITAFGTGVAAALGQNVSGSGSIALTTSPVFTTPNLGTPSAATLTSATGLPISTGVSGLGTNVATALAVNVGSAGAFVVNGGALGTPSGGVLTNATGLPISTGVTGLGTNVATALGVNVGSAGAFVVNGGALGTPSGGTLTNATGLPIDGGTTGTLPAGRGGTGLTALGTGVATFLGTPSSANLAAAVTGETGTGALVFATSPTLVTPTIGVATATSINGLVLNRGTGTNNAESVAVGGTALDSSNNSAAENTAVGYAAGTGNTSGKKNVFVGWSAGKDLTTGENGIYLGHDAKASGGGATNEIVIGQGKTGLGNNTTFVAGSSGVFNENDTTTWNQVSDERIKREIVDAQGGLAIIDALRVRNFRYKTAEQMPLDTNGRPLAQNKDPDKLRIGFVAQELEQVLPESVTVQSNGVRSVNIDALHYHLILAVQQLSRRVAELEAR